MSKNKVNYVGGYQKNSNLPSILILSPSSRHAQHPYQNFKQKNIYITLEKRKPTTQFTKFASSSLLYVLLAVSFACVAVAFGPDCSPIATVPDFDLVPYMGVWYEQGTSAVPRDTFQRNLHCTRAIYTLGSAYVNVNNSGFTGIQTDHFCF